jgi:pyruvate/2-oxoglutarate dehydrogenase complex dihydrolipoamide acyltransferase (E2) component
MTHDVRLPKLDTAGSEIAVAAWLRQPGDRIQAGDIIAEVQTDKVNLEIESPVTGVLEAIVAQEGAVVVEGDVLARVALVE